MSRHGFIFYESAERTSDPMVKLPATRHANRPATSKAKRPAKRAPVPRDHDHVKIHRLTFCGPVTAYAFFGVLLPPITVLSVEDFLENHTPENYIFYIKGKGFTCPRRTNENGNGPEFSFMGVTKIALQQARQQAIELEEEASLKSNAETESDSES